MTYTIRADFINGTSLWFVAAEYAHHRKWSAVRTGAKHFATLIVAQQVFSLLADTWLRADEVIGVTLHIEEGDREIQSLSTMRLAV